MQHQIKSYVFKGDITQDKYARTIDELSSLKNILWLDSRVMAKFEKGHIPDALHVSFKDWEGALQIIFENFEPGQNIVVYCNPSCSTSRNMAQKLRQELQQENIFFLKGGFAAWQKK